jgi:hypothetical protein
VGEPNSIVLVSSKEGCMPFRGVAMTIIMNSSRAVMDPKKTLSIIIKSSEKNRPMILWRPEAR